MPNMVVLFQFCVKPQLTNEQVILGYLTRSQFNTTVTKPYSELQGSVLIIQGKPREYTKAALDLCAVGNRVDQPIKI